MFRGSGPSAEQPFQRAQGAALELLLQRRPKVFAGLYVCVQTRKKRRWRIAHVVMVALSAGPGSGRRLSILAFAKTLMRNGDHVPSVRTIWLRAVPEEVSRVWPCWSSDQNRSAYGAYSQGEICAISLRHSSCCSAAIYSTAIWPSADRSCAPCAARASAMEAGSSVCPSPRCGPGLNPWPPAAMLRGCRAPRRTLRLKSSAGTGSAPRCSPRHRSAG